MRIMFDTNAFDKMYSSDDTLNKITHSDKNEYCITSIQIEEIGDIPDSKKEQRIRNLLALCEIKAQLLLVPAVVGRSRVGYCIPSDENELYERLLKETRNNVKDAMIGVTAKRENCVVVTDDLDFSKRLNKNMIPTMTFSDFINSL